MRTREDLEGEVVSLRDSVRAFSEEIALLRQIRLTAKPLIRGEATVAQHMSLRDAIEHHEGRMAERAKEAQEKRANAS